MQRLLITISALSFSTIYCWDCPQNGILELNTGTSFPANPNDNIYPANRKCIMVIPGPPQGYYVKVYVDADNMSPQDSFIFYDDTNLNIKYDPIVTPEIGSPRTLSIKVDTSANTKGTFSFNWKYLAIAPNKVPIEQTVATSQKGALIVTETAYIAPYLITSNVAISLVTAGASDEKLRLYNMFTFVFEGAGVTGKYLGSLYSMLDASVFNCHTNQITIATMAAFDCGVIVAKAQNDISGYNYRLVYNWDLGKEIVLDGSNKPTAISIYSADAGNVYIYSPVFQNNKGNLNWQTQDLRPNTPIMKSYGPKNDLDKLPQAIPGYIKTLIADGDKITIPVSLDVPKAYLNVPDGAYTIFPSRNFMAKGQSQANSATFMTGEKRFNMTCSVGNAFDGTSFTVKVTDGKNVNTATLKQGDKHYFLGNKFEISYPVAADFVTAGGLSTLSFSDTNGSTDNGNTTTTTPTPTTSESTSIITTSTLLPTTSRSGFQSLFISLCLMFLAVY